MDIEAQRRIAAILGILDDSEQSLGASRIAEALRDQGVELKERMVRYYLEETDRRGYTENHGRRGRSITAKGRKELSMAVAVDRMGTLPSKYAAYAFNTRFDPYTGDGKVTLNRSFVPSGKYAEARAIIRTVMSVGLGMGQKISIDNRASRCRSGYLEIGTISGVTIDGVFRRNGIPVSPRFCGLLEMIDNMPRRITEMIQYKGCTLEPMTMLIKGKMTRTFDAAQHGSGLIGVSFREFPEEALPRAKELATALAEIGLCRVLGMAASGTLFGAPVSTGRVAMVLPSGLNPIAALEEQGLGPEIEPVSMLKDFGELTECPSGPSDRPS